MKEMAYPIRAVARLTGLSVDTLRAWERRYDAVKPKRAGRSRTYSEGDIRRLNLLREAVEAGHAIGQIASLSNQQLQAMAGRVATLAASRENGLTGRAAASVAATELGLLLGAIEAFDYLAADRELSRLATLMTPRALVHQVVIPLMETVGEQYYRGKMSAAQEHMTSAILRNLLGGLVRLYARTAPPASLLFATPSGEQHEFGILCAAMLAAAGGLGIVYLGLSLPASEIVAAAEKTAVQVVVLGLKGATPSNEPMEELQRISQSLPARIELWVGGPASPTLAAQIKKTRARFLADFDALEQQLTRCGAKF